MKLIRKLRTRLINSRKESYGLFWCDVCYQEVEKQLSNGLKAKSCGSSYCKQKNKGNKYSFKHGESFTRLYHTWEAMKQRIINPNNKKFKNYGERGITVCNEWLEFIPFRDWALNNGYQENLILDRKETNGNYEPSNCRFITILESNRNKTTTITMEIANEIRYLDSAGKYTQKELAEKYNVSQSNISMIIRRKRWTK